MYMRVYNFGVIISFIIASFVYPQYPSYILIESIDIANGRPKSPDEEIFSQTHIQTFTVNALRTLKKHRPR